MAKLPGKRVVMNRAALDAFKLGMADGLGQALQDVRATADAEMPAVVAKTGGVWVAYEGRKVAGDGNKPKGLRSAKGTVVGIVGYGSPIAHLWEFGTNAHEITIGTDEGPKVLSSGTGGAIFGTTVHHPGTAPRPTLLPAFNAKINGAGRYILAATAARMRRVR